MRRKNTLTCFLSDEFAPVIHELFIFCRVSQLLILEAQGPGEDICAMAAPMEYQPQKLTSFARGFVVFFTKDFTELVLEAPEVEGTSLVPTEVGRPVEDSKVTAIAADSAVQEGGSEKTVVVSRADGVSFLAAEAFREPSRRTGGGAESRGRLRAGAIAATETRV